MQLFFRSSDSENDSIIKEQITFKWKHDNVNEFGIKYKFKLLSNVTHI